MIKTINAKARLKSGQDVVVTAWSTTDDGRTFRYRVVYESGRSAWVPANQINWLT